MPERSKLLKHLAELDHSIAELEELLADVPMTKAQRLNAEGRIQVFRASLEPVELVFDDPNEGK